MLQKEFKNYERSDVDDAFGTKIVQIRSLESSSVPTAKRNCILLTIAIVSKIPVDVAVKWPARYPRIHGISNDLWIAHGEKLKLWK